MATALDSPNPEKQKLSKRIAEDIALFLEGGGRIQVLAIQARHHPDFDMGVSEEVREAQRRRGVKGRRAAMAANRHRRSRVL